MGMTIEPDAQQQTPLQRSSQVPLADALVAFLEALGVRRAFGIVGGAIAPLTQALQRSGLSLVQYRHECGAAYAAVEASLSTGELVVVYVTTGPGLLNAVNGLMNGRWEGAKILCLSGATSLAMAGRHAAQATESYRFPMGQLYQAGNLFHMARLLQHSEELPTFLQRLATGMRQKQGFIAHLALPVDIQMAMVDNKPIPLIQRQASLGQESGLDELVALLPKMRAEKTFLWVGHGARNDSGQIVRLAEQMQWPVVATPHGKGIFPEQHPLYLGISGLGGHRSVQQWIGQEQPGYALVLGSKLGENSTYWDKGLLPRKQIIHVDVDPDVFGNAYPDMATLGVCCTVEHVVQALIKAPMPPQLQQGQSLSLPTPQAGTPCPAAFPQPVQARSGKGWVRPQVLMQAVQTYLIDQPEMPVIMAETGNTFAWALHWLKMQRPKQFRINAQYCSMGHFNGGALGYWLATQKPCVVLTGDGALLMNNEINTAVACGARILWVVLNDAGFGMIRQGMHALRFDNINSDFPGVDFAAFARAQGAKGYSIQQESQLASILPQAWQEQQPTIVDVAIDSKQISPLLGRVESLKWQSIGQQEDGSRG